MKRKAIFLFFIAGSIASTQGFKNPPVGSSALSQAGAFVAQSDDATATAYNPAGLIQIDKQEIILGTTYIYSETKFSNGTYSTEKKFSPVFLPYFFYAKKISENFGFGIGMFSPYGQTVKWGFDAVKKWGYMVPYYSSMQTAQTSLAFAFKINHSLSTGFGLNFFTSRVVQNSLLPSEQLLKMKATGQTCSPSFGILYKKEKYSIGLNYQCPFRIGYSGKVRIPDFYQESVKTKIDFPSVLITGIAFYPTKKLKIEADAEYVGFSNFEKMPVKIGKTTSYEIERKWKEVYDFYFGFEYKKSKNVKFRGGVGYIKSPIPDSTWEPTFPDADRIAIAFGSEIKSKFGFLDICFVQSIFDKTNLKKGGNYDGIYKTKSTFFTVQFKKYI